MTQRSLVQRLISFLKKPDALESQETAQAHNPYDDYQPHEVRQDPEMPQPAEAPDPVESAQADPFDGYEQRRPGYASRLDALVMRALQQFKAETGYVIRQDRGRMRYCTGRDWQGRYLAYNEVAPDRKAVTLAIDSGESQLVVRRGADDVPQAVLCGPLWDGNELVGLLYLDRPARNRLHRGVFDVFCQQAARALISEAAFA